MSERPDSPDVSGRRQHPFGCRPDCQIRARRRIAMRLGFAALVVVSATACIFEKSDYKGGGRIDKGAAAKTAESASSTATTAPTDSSDGSDGSDASTPPNPFLDAAGDG